MFIQKVSLTAYLWQLRERGRTHELKSNFTRFGDFWIECKQKQKIVYNHVVAHTNQNYHFLGWSDTQALKNPPVPLSFCLQDAIFFSSRIWRTWCHFLSLLTFYLTSSLTTFVGSSVLQPKFCPSHLQQGIFDIFYHLLPWKK